MLEIRPLSGIPGRDTILKDIPGKIVGRYALAALFIHILMQFLF